MEKHMNRVSKSAVNKYGKIIPCEDWHMHAVVWIVGPLISAMLSYGLARLAYLWALELMR